MRAGGTVQSIWKMLGNDFNLQSLRRGKIAGVDSTAFLQRISFCL